ncbi:MAG: outer membrane beta-barrel protein [candidate division Zixibacteria bacterium]|nr:outer membrane beta-barrel protein [candidate division Zixibacteria bacterium]MDD5425750.1 outer membrane beta-barrel protein [candidate division Zixibacteria bacterium]
MKKYLLIIMVLAFLPTPGKSQVQVRDSYDKSLPFDKRHQAGIRLGVWLNQGDEPSGRDSSVVSYKMDIGNTNFYFEGFGAYRLNPRLMFEFSLGFVNRGNVTLYDGRYSYVGNLVVYSILAHVKLYPLPRMLGKLYPYITAGGGLYYGRHDVQFTTDYDFFRVFNEKSGTDFNYVVGGGFDWPLSGTIGLDMNVKYMPISLSNTIVDISNFDALSISVGVKYLFESGK